MDWPNGSMLAEPRYRVRASQDPNGTAWAKDENKFGKRMLERMGWSKGKGLGAKEDGMKDHVKVATKNNTRGLGCSAKQADFWTAHQDGFNALLQNLNKSCSASNSPAGSDSESGKVSSLEHLSKNSKARVHYQKFTKGKDLSSRSEKDLACIFGHKGKKSKSEALEEDVPDQTADTKEADEEEVDSSHGVVTIQNKLSVQEYFKLKMAERLRRSSGGVAGTSTPDSRSSSKSSSPEPSHSAQSSASEAGLDALAAESKKTKKSKKRKREEMEESCDPEELHSAAVDGTEEGSSSRKKKKKKDKQRAGMEESCESPDQDVQASSPSSPSSESRKKKKKDKRKEMAEGTSETPDSDMPSVIINETSAESKKKKKKDKKRKVADETFEASDPEMLPASPSSPASESKKKKKKKRKSEEEDAAVPDVSSEKKRKSVSFAEMLVHSVTVDEIDDSMDAHHAEGSAKEEDTSDLKTSGKKKKKKAKKEKLEKNNGLAVDDSSDKDEGSEASQETDKASEELASTKASEKKKKKKEKKCSESDNVTNGVVESDRGLNTQAKVEKKPQATLSWKMAARSVEGYHNLKLKH